MIQNKKQRCQTKRNKDPQSTISSGKFLRNYQELSWNDDLAAKDVKQALQRIGDDLDAVRRERLVAKQSCSGSHTLRLKRFQSCFSMVHLAKEKLSA